MNRILRFAAPLALIVALIVPVAIQAQTILNYTTLSAGVSVGDTRFNITSATGNQNRAIAVNDLGFVDTEMVRVTAVSGSTITVTRGWNSTVATAHASGARFWFGPVTHFDGRVPRAGVCVRSQQPVLPIIDVATATFYTCDALYGPTQWRATNVLPLQDNSLIDP